MPSGITCALPAASRSKLPGVRPEDVNYFLAGDLLNQLITSNFVAHSLGIPFYGLFNACATIAEGLALGAALVDGGFADRVLVGASSHYQTAERQYRYPIELNVQRKPTNHWTTTGAGAALLARDGAGPRLTLHTAGRVIDYGLKDVNDMGSAMAPAAADTLLRHLADTGRHVGDYDLILTGDLGRQGSKMFRMLVKEVGITLGGKHKDGGVMMFSRSSKPAPVRAVPPARPPSSSATPLKRWKGAATGASCACLPVRFTAR